MNDKEAIEWVAGLWGTKVTEINVRSIDGNYYGKRTYKAQIMGSNAVAWFDAMKPWLTRCRLTQFDEILARCERRSL
jgi:hypothetical protein